ncbi:DUF6168 family protein [Algibacter sp. Ld11]|uniref:DUF6168 family protein n=1 Tax=Algibacter sp. Ld11 TaxID=649150 RepID=UPI00386DC209
MIKRILIVAAILLALFLTAYNLQNHLTTETLSFSLLSVYLFHLIAAVIVYVTVELVAEKLPNQAGYAYLTLMFFKIGAFVLIFQSSVFANDNLTQMERIGLVIPLFLFLITEAIAVSKLLNSK